MGYLGRSKYETSIRAKVELLIILPRDIIITKHLEVQKL